MEDGFGCAGSGLHHRVTHRSHRSNTSTTPDHGLVLHFPSLMPRGKQLGEYGPEISFQVILAYLQDLVVTASTFLRRDNVSCSGKQEFAGGVECASMDGKECPRVTGDLHRSHSELARARPSVDLCALFSLAPALKLVVVDRYCWRVQQVFLWSARIGVIGVVHLVCQGGIVCIRVPRSFDGRLLSTDAGVKQWTPLFSPVEPVVAD
ncbi:uncharacterized protein ARMOST_08482 [Armillaria ostoyae]|uniref:Uncharacterized protein n=1 Tax=Armillaria ostoyae TaxID=47428 RepID=A0A284R8Q4_ARMOS|nr:uncharacterized protein ARMOST_08482 [Armillaria ostoyae]